MANALVKLRADDWERVALEALAEQGLPGVAVEPLARKLGVTKGSFYWHFEDRDALLAAALARWEADYTERLIAELEAAVEDPRERLVRLLTVVADARKGDRIHVALAAAAGSHDRVRAALARVSERRVGYLQGLYVRLGMPAAAARKHAVLAYTAYVGLVHLRVEGPETAPAGRSLAAYVEHLVETLVPPARGGRSGAQRTP
jgi:AcrR family transcriptional regulator